MFFLMLRRLPRPTLFPYTTLFRSERRWDEEAALPSPQVICGCDTDSRSKGETGHEQQYHRDHRMRPGRQAERALRGGRGGDRKSTRLNSSHSSISYAVFCLKKKTK